MMMNSGITDLRYGIYLACCRHIACDANVDGKPALVRQGPWYAWFRVVSGFQV